jgi:dTDP-4-dehydrorhamnose reductase
MRILLAGHKGQLGRILMKVLDAHRIMGVDLPEYDITDLKTLRNLVRDFCPHLILNSAAMTDVDGCANNPQQAYQVNGVGAQNLALIAAEIGAEMLQISTNEVFNGKADEPYDEWAHRDPINAYGRSKLAGERAVESMSTRFYIVRTAWLFAPGGRNFPHRIIALAEQKGSLRVVDDEVSNPTYAYDLAQAVQQLIGTHAYGYYHFVNEGATSRYDFAREILILSGRKHIPITPIKSSEWERASTPPLYAPLANYAGAAHGIRLRDWKQALNIFLRETGYSQ